MRPIHEVTTRTHALNLTRFIDYSPTPFHAVGTMSTILKDAGFRFLSEDEPWKLGVGDRCIVTRNGSTIGAFIVGSKPVFDSGFRIIGAHTDSPNLRLKPNAVYDKAGYVQLAVEPYGGLLLASWLNRDLSVAGRVIIRSKNGRLYTALTKIDGPLLSIPQLAIHLDRDVNEKGLILDKQKHLPPICGLTDTKVGSLKRFHTLLRRDLGHRIMPEDEIVQMDLALYDINPSTIGGMESEFIFAPRLDNLASCHAAVTALAATEHPICTCVIACYDDEEVGSASAQGAHSPFLRDILERITETLPSRDGYKRAIARSFCISADMAHAVHPNYPEKHEPHHMPVIGGGPVIKTNANKRYASDACSTAFFMELCHRAHVPYQNFVTRSDLACGSTIGPITATELGIATVDVGSPMLSMHSIREQAGVADHHRMIKVMSMFFDNTTADLKIE